MKAYDRIEWGYLHFLYKIGFPPSWIALGDEVFYFG
jgi:hypothetical protein